MGPADLQTVFDPKAGDVLQCRPGIPDATAVVKALHVSGRPAEAATAGDTVELGMGGVDEAFAPLGAVLCVQNGYLIRI